MTNNRWLLAIPVILAATIAGASAQGATVRDRAGVFSADAVQKARAQLEKIEQATGIPIVIEAIGAIPGLDKNAPKEARRKAIDALALERDREIRDEGIYILISKRDHVISHVMIRERYADVLSIEKRDAIQDAFLKEFRNHENYDGGLMSGVKAIEQSLEGVSARGPVARAGHVHARVADRAGGQMARGRSMIGTFLLILAGIFGVLLVLKLVGGLFGRSAGAGYPGPQGGMGMPRPGMGGGPGYYGGPGYGGRGGGFFSGLLGGLGGAFAGNWLYDQFSGRHGNLTSADAVSPTDHSTGSPDQGGDAIIGASDDPGGGASWDDGGGGADVGGGDWGGGGGDWGGGGGDWGGGGGDWGGGGGGDW
jgi:TPM domain